MKIKDAVKLLKPYFGKMLVIMLLAVVIAAISAVTPFVSQAMIDRGIMQGSMQTVVTMAVLVIGLQMGSFLIEYVQQLQEINIANDLGKKLKTQAFEHGLKLKPGYYKDKGFMQIMSDAVYYISSIMSIASSSFMTVIVVIFKCIGALIGLFMLDWRLALFVLAFMPIKIVVNLYMRKRAEKLGKKLMDVNKSFNSWYSNIIQGITDIKLLNLERRSIGEYAVHTENINTASKKQSLMSRQNMLISQTLETVLSYSLYIIGGFFITKGGLTFGGLVAFISFTAYVLLPVNVLFNLSIILKQITPCVEGLAKFNELEEENYSGQLMMPEKIETIVFKDVSVTFDSREILKNIDLEIHRGEKVAIVGENGSGKTTLMNLLLRFCEPTGGQVLINGVPVEKYNVVDYRRKMSVVMQEVHLFKGTVMDNIAPGEDSDMSVIYDDALSFCTDVIKNWEKEYDTEVGIDGMKLSGGERQKIALLRAMGRRGRILIMDEPTSNYDKESEEQFDTFIKEKHDYDFCFVITHRKDILKNVDKIVTVEGGTVDTSRVV